MDRKTRRRYSTESRMVSAGVPMMCKSPGAAAMPSTVMIPPQTAARIMAVCTERETSSSSLAPMNWAIITVAPEDTPVKKPMIRFRIWAEEPPTAARASVPTKRPTIMVSTVL